MRQIEVRLDDGELHRPAGLGAVPVVEQGAAVGVVDDAVARVVAGVAREEGIGGEPAGVEIGEDRVVEENGILEDREVGDRVDVALERRVEQEAVLAPAAGERVSAAPAGKDVAASGSVQVVSAMVADDDIGEPVA